MAYQFVQCNNCNNSKVWLVTGLKTVDPASNTMLVGASTKIRLCLPDL